MCIYYYYYLTSSAEGTGLNPRLPSSNHEVRPGQDAVAAFITNLLRYSFDKSRMDTMLLQLPVLRTGRNGLQHLDQVFRN
jgi:hypothetical protein